MPFMEIEQGVNLFYEVLGPEDGKVMLSCQEGFGGDGYMQLLADAGFRIYKIHIRGSEKSTHVAEDHGERWWDIWAEDAVTFADKIGADKFYYIGASHGAGIGWHICYRHPERVIAFLGIVCGPHQRGGLETSQARWEVIQAAQSWETWHEFVIKRFGGRPEATGSETPEELKRLQFRQAMFDAQYNKPLECSRMNPRKPFNWCKTEEELMELMSTIKAEALLLGGIKDDIATPATMIRSATAVKNAKLVLYEDAGHSLASEKPKEIVDDILRFLMQRGLM